RTLRRSVHPSLSRPSLNAAMQLLNTRCYRVVRTDGTGTGFVLRYFFAAFRGTRCVFLTAPVLADAAMLKSSSFAPVLSAAVSHRGLSPRPAHVSAGLSGLRYFGATGCPFKALRPAWLRLASPDNAARFLSFSSRTRRSSVTLDARIVSTSSLSW